MAFDKQRRPATEREARALASSLRLRILRLCLDRPLTNKEIAARLAVSVKTVETYKSRAAEKLKLRTRADIVRFGASQGWLVDLESD